MTCPDEGFPHMRNKDSGARTGLAPAIPAYMKKIDRVKLIDSIRGV